MIPYSSLTFSVPFQGVIQLSTNRQAPLTIPLCSLMFPSCSLCRAVSLPKQYEIPSPPPPQPGKMPNKHKSRSPRTKLGLGHVGTINTLADGQTPLGTSWLMFVRMGCIPTGADQPGFCPSTWAGFGLAASPQPFCFEAWKSGICSGVRRHLFGRVSVCRN